MSSDLEIKEEIGIKDLLEVGAHFGHQRRKWNPKMKRFVFDLRHGLYIIDLAKTLSQLRDCQKILKSLVAQKKSVLFVGTKKQAKNTIKEVAEACGEFYICERWLGGMLTNMSTIRQSIKTLDKIEKKVATGAEGMTKKEVSLLTKEQLKLERNFSGIRSMRRPPGLLIVVDPSHEHIAVAEAKKMGIPVMALVDTNCNPDPIDYVIPCNDDALKSVKLIIEALAKVIIETKNEMKVNVEEDVKSSDYNPTKETIASKESSDE